MRIRLPSLLRGTALAALLGGAAAAGPAPAAAQENIVICAQQPVPAGYVVVAAGRDQQCPGFWSDFNVLTVRVPGDTVTVCSTQTADVPGYVVTARGRRQECPNFWSESNTATYRRLAQTPDAPQAPAGPELMVALDEYTRVVRQRLRAAEAQMGLDAPTHLPWGSWTAPGGTTSTGVRLEAGVTYALVGVCDQDCDALSLVLRAPSGAVVQSTAPGPQPEVRVTPAATGVWTLQASARQCRARSCYLAVGAYQVPPVVVDAPPQRPPQSLPVRPTPRPRP